MSKLVNCNSNLVFKSSEPFEAARGRMVQGIPFVVSLSNHERLTLINCHTP